MTETSKAAYIRERNAPAPEPVHVQAANPAPADPETPAVDETPTTEPTAETSEEVSE